MRRHPDLEPRRQMPLGAGAMGGYALLIAGFDCLNWEYASGRWSG
ncbi:hypothetical protein ABT297_37630 [Dactylosporangium sp. NPDC000555]